jgi:molybdopterin-guanine dinucleotide biosynthesis protein A
VDFDAVVLAGGISRRMSANSTDKTGLDVGGASLLDRAADAVAAAARIVVVGQPRPVGRSVVWTLEEPPGSGPAAALMAGLAGVEAEVVVVLAADLPFAATAVPRLVAALATQTADATMLVDESGRRQPLLAAYATAALRARAADGPWADRSVRDLVAPLRVVEVTALPDEALDCDTPDDLALARTRAGRANSPPTPASQPRAR